MPGASRTRRPRTAHEEGIVYLTEDNFGFPSGLYRYIPPSNPMQVGGCSRTAACCRCCGWSVRPTLTSRRTSRIGATYAVDWVDIDDANPTFPYTPGETAPTTNNDAINYVGNQGRALGAAHFSRLEGAVFTKGEIFFTSTQGGGAAETGPDTVTGYGNGAGQIWSYDPRRALLTCHYQSPGTTTLELPDNITARNDNGTVVLCEDGPVDNYIRAAHS